LLRFDFLVIGSGIAGLSYALKASSLGSVAVITKKRKSDSNTNYAQGGIAAVMSSTDSFEKHIADTLITGCGLSHLDVVKRIVTNGPACIAELIALGVDFSIDKRRGASWGLELSREGGHSERRVVHSADMTGREIERALLRRVHESPNITLYENHIAADLITVESDNGRQCVGATCLDSRSHHALDFYAGTVLLATGGAGVVYKHTTNPSIATGDGVAMAYRAGASVANMEFIQFHPTTLYHPDGNSFLISEAVRGEGALLLTRSGDRFMHKYHEMAELAPRDIVARAIDAELKASGDLYVYLDMTHLGSEFIKKRFPHIYQTCLNLEIDITKERIPVVPAAHYCCGGVKTDQDGRTDIKSLFACGEVAMTGMHGANRLASNSLLEAIAYARFAADVAEVVDISSFIDDIRRTRRENGVGERLKRKERVLLEHDRSELLNLMWDYVGVVRSDYRLNRAHERISILVRDIEDYVRTRGLSFEAIELRNLATCAKLIIDFALERKESRGLHYNNDHPETDDINWKRELTRKEDEWI
jgi:L-aspartate oxidase